MTAADIYLSAAKNWKAKQEQEQKQKRSAGKEPRQELGAVIDFMAAKRRLRD